MNQNPKSKGNFVIILLYLVVLSVHLSDRRRASEAADALGQALQNAYVFCCLFVCLFVFEGTTH